MNENIMNKLIEMGAKRWTKADKDRLYLNDAVAEIIGLEVSCYKSGNVSSATLKGESISNSKASKLMVEAGSMYIDLTTGKIYGNASEELVEEVRAWIEAAENEEVETAETYEVEFMGGESRTVIVNAEKGVCNYMMTTVTDKDGEEHELYAEIAVSEIYDDANDFDDDDFDERTYQRLVDEIVRQAAEYGIIREQLHFYND